MAPPRHSIEAIARARQLYAEGVRVAEISAATGVPVGTLYFHFDRGTAGVAGSHLPRRHIVLGRRDAAVKTPPSGLAAELWRAAEAAARRVGRITQLTGLAVEPSSGHAAGGGAADRASAAALRARNLRALARMIELLAAAEQESAAKARVDFSAAAAREIETVRSASAMHAQISAVATRAEILRARTGLAAIKLRSRT